MDESALSRPVWNALLSEQKELSCSNGDARRFAPVYGPLTAAIDYSQVNMAALRMLEIGPEGLWIFDQFIPQDPTGFEPILCVPCVQMIAYKTIEIENNFEVVELQDSDAAQMLALAMATRPGPFSTETYKLGQFIGVKENGRLIAMAGERMKITGFSELSGVCTHAEYRGRGLARILSQIITKRILERGEIPFLHTYQGNDVALRLYEGLGYKSRAIVHLTVLKPT
jgi:predicted GNAT family acetyltransferase